MYVSEWYQDKCRNRARSGFYEKPFYIDLRGRRINFQWPDEFRTCDAARNMLNEMEILTIKNVGTKIKTPSGPGRPSFRLPEVMSCDSGICSA